MTTRTEAAATIRRAAYDAADTMHDAARWHLLADVLTAPCVGRQALWRVIEHAYANAENVALNPDRTDADDAACLALYDAGRLAERVAHAVRS